MSYPFGDMIHIHFHAVSAAVSGDISGIEILAGATGCLIHRMELISSAAHSYNVLSTGHLDAGFATITPTTIAKPSYTPLSVIRTGVEAAGAVLPAPAYKFLAQNAGMASWSAYPGLWVPPGYYFTIADTTVNTQCSVSFIISEREAQ